MCCNNRRKKRIAFAITLTKDGFFQDGAAVLAYSIYKVSKSKNKNFKYFFSNFYIK